MDGLEKNLRNYPIRRFFGIILLGMGFLGRLQLSSILLIMCLFTSGFMQPLMPGRSPFFFLKNFSVMHVVIPGRIWAKHPTLMIKVQLPSMKSIQICSPSLAKYGFYVSQGILFIVVRFYV